MIPSLATFASRLGRFGRVPFLIYSVFNGGLRRAGSQKVSDPIDKLHSDDSQLKPAFPACLRQEGPRIDASVESRRPSDCFVVVR